MVGALLLGGATVAMAEGEPPADGTVDLTVEPTTQVEPAAQAEPTVPSAAAEPDTGQQQRTESGAPAEDTGSQQQDVPGDQGTDQQATDTKGTQTPSAQTAPSEKSMGADARKAVTSAEQPTLRWQLRDDAGAVVAGATVMLQGPRDSDAVDNGNDEQWATAPETTIADNTGQADYVGADLDPAPGFFSVEEFADVITPDAEPHRVVPDNDYRIRVSDADGFVVGEKAEWITLAPLTDANADATQVALAPQAPEKKVAARDAGLVSPMALGPDGANPPYVYWTVEDGAGNLVGGASFDIQGPRQWSGGVFGSWSWSTNEATIVDNGPGDLDPDAGEILVKAFDGHSIDSDLRYRIRRADAPAGYRFTSNSDWREIDRLSRWDEDVADPDEWPGDVHDFGEFGVEKLPNMAPICTPGNFYSILSNGQLRHIAPNGAVTSVGTAANPNSGDMNGLGIGADGDPVYAIQRTGNSKTATVYKFNTTTGVWSNTGDSEPTDVGLVAGAVNLNTGEYVFGGYNDGGTRFYMWSYDGSDITPLGYVQTGASHNTTSNNGDMAFNADGDLFIVLGRGSNVIIVSVTAANFNAADGGEIPAASSTSRSTDSYRINGIAFDAGGKGYLGDGTTATSYDMPNWSGADEVTDNLHTSSNRTSTDLASCGSPATITLQKRIIGERANSSDQFKLTLKQGGDELGTATTAGSASGVQPQIVGPLPVVRGATLNFSEAFVNGAQSGDYATTYQCLVDGEPLSPAVAGNGTSGSVTIPTIGEQVVCEFVNTPLTAKVTINKAVRELGQDTPEAASGWTVNAVPTATTGAVTRSPNASQQTDQAGQADWTLNFSTPLSRATVNVSETQQPGYEFESGQCTITRSVGDPIEVELDSEAATALTGVGPGDQVDCAYVNRQIPGAIHWEKITDDDPAEHIGGSTWTVKGPGSNGPTITVEDCIGAAAADCAAATDKDHRAGYLRVVDLAWGTYTITETQAPDGFELGDVTTWQVTITAANAEAGATIDPVVNARKLGSVTWSKVSADTGELLGGSVWTLTGPGHPTPGTEIEDCVADADEDCTGLDKDSDAGVLRIVGLAWGDYTLVETSAPLGYLLDATEYTFTVNASTIGAVIEIGDIENTLATPPTLPLTGGLGADFYKFAGLGILLLGAMLFIARRLWMRKQHAATRT